MLSDIIQVMEKWTGHAESHYFSRRGVDVRLWLGKEIEVYVIHGDVDCTITFKDKWTVEYPHTVIKPTVKQKKATENFVNCLLHILKEYR